MEVDSEDNRNKTKNSGRVLRKRKKKSYVDRVVKHTIENSRPNRSKRATRRHRSLDPPKIDALSTDSHVPRPSTSTSSLGSVIYVGCYRKIPKIITLDENNDSFENQGQNKGQNETPLSPSENGVEKMSTDQVLNNSWNEKHDTNNLLNLLSEMYVGATYKRIVTRARTRECKN